MKKREDIVQKFSTFLSLGDYDTGQNSNWQVDPELERQMKRLLQSQPEAKEEFWARHFLKILKGISQDESSYTTAEESKESSFRSKAGMSPTLLSTSRLKTLEKRSTDTINCVSTDSRLSLRAGRHLLAYLQEACLWAAHKRYQKFKYLRHKYSLEEYFQIANSAINPPVKIFKSFNLERLQSNIEGYAKTAIIRFINNTIYQQDLEAKRNKFSDYGLLKDLNTKEIKESLVYNGIKTCEIDLYCLAWLCFDEICQPNQSQGNRCLEPPTHQHLKHIVSCYNQRLNKLDFPAVPADVEKIQEMLETCIQAARNYRNKRLLPLEGDDMCDTRPTPWDTVMQEEEWKQVKQIVSKLFEAIPETGQTLLKLSLGLNFTQIEIATVLKNDYSELQKQYQVARQMGKYIRNLLGEFVNEWNKIHPETCLKNDKEIERIKESLMECVRLNCYNLLHSLINNIFKEYRNKERILIFPNNSTLNQEPNTEFLTIPISEIYHRLADAKPALTNAFHQELEITMSLTRGSLQNVSGKVADFVDEWLQNYPNCISDTRK